MNIEDITTMLTVRVMLWLAVFGLGCFMAGFLLTALVGWLFFSWVIPVDWIDQYLVWARGV